MVNKVCPACRIPFEDEDLVIKIQIMNIIAGTREALDTDLVAHLKCPRVGGNRSLTGYDVREEIVSGN